MNIQIRSTGRYLPSTILRNTDLEAELGRSLSQFTTKNGVHTRHRSMLCKGESTSQMCVWAAKEALNNANMSKEELDLIIFASASVEQAIPDTAPLVQAKLGLGRSGIRCFSVHTTCLSFLTALDIAGCFIHSRRHNNILVDDSDQWLSSTTVKRRNN